MKEAVKINSLAVVVDPMGVGTRLKVESPIDLGCEVEENGKN